VTSRVLSQCCDFIRRFDNERYRINVVSFEIHNLTCISHSGGYTQTMNCCVCIVELKSRGPFDKRARGLLDQYTFLGPRFHPNPRFTNKYSVILMH